MIGDIDFFTGFGDNPETSVKFGLLLDGSQQMADWEGEAKISFHDIANSDKTVTQYHGRGPVTLEVELEFESLVDYESLDALIGHYATLRYAWGTTKSVGGYKETRNFFDYLVLPDTMLLSLSSSYNTTVVGDARQAMAIFWRPYASSDYYDFAVYEAEDV